jgi:hypothetical protein
MRNEVFNFVLAHKEDIREVKMDEMRLLPKPLVACLSDKSGPIRQKADEVISEIMPITGYAVFQKVLTDLPTAFQNTLKPMLEKIKKACGGGAAPVDANNGSLGASLNKTPKDDNNGSLTNTAKPKPVGKP